MKILGNEKTENTLKDFVGKLVYSYLIIRVGHLRVSPARYCVVTQLVDVAVEYQWYKIN
jgi:hypothetical protein